MGKNEAEQTMVRATAFELLSLMFLLPDSKLAEALAAGEFAAAGNEVSAALTDQSGHATEGSSELFSCYAGRDADEVLHEVRAEYTRLFVGEKLPIITPFAGIWAAQQQGQDALLFVSKQSLEIERLMHRCGVAKDLPSGQVNDPLDHFGTMCEFAKYLHLVSAGAVAVPEGFEVSDDDFTGFMAEYFRPYATWLVGALREQARRPFYEDAAGFLSIVLAATE